MNNKVLLLGIDGGTFDLIKPWIERGELPTFEKVVHEGSYSNLKTVIPCLSLPAIPSLYTGKNPGKLGFFGFQKADGSLVEYSDIKEDPIWDILGEKGFKSCIVNLTRTYPPKIENGIMISGDPPSEKSEYVYPKEFKSKVSGFHSEFKKIKKLEKNPHENMPEITTYALMAVEKNWRIFKDVMTSDDFALGFLWVILSDDIQYFYWSHKDIILKFFKQIDDILRDLINTFGNHNLIIVSDHGFEDYPKYDFHINSWLRNNGYLKMKGGKIRKWFTYRILTIFPCLRKWLPRKVKYLLMNIKSRLPSSSVVGVNGTCAVELDHMRSFLLGVDWKNTIAYADVYFWGIRVNVDQELYEITRIKLIEELKGLKDKEGNSVMREVWKKEEIFSGKYLDQIPDIVLLPQKKYRTNPLLLEKIFTKINEDTTRGTHMNARNGIFIAYGPIFKKGYEVKSDLNIVDIAPTVLHIMGCEVPEDMDGRVLKEIFKEESEPAKWKIKYQKRDKKIERKRGISQKEANSIKERLRTLGYLDHMH